jgi:septum formation topological specificity factor MinE
MTAARKTDPTTSKDAARLDAGILEGLRADIYKVIARRPKTGYADHELVEVMAKYTTRTPQRIRTARAELAKSLLLLPTGEFRKSPTGRRAQVWSLA